jgi:aspartate racemase
MSWESSAIYYRILNKAYQKLRGGNRSCPCVLYSVDFEEIEQLQHEGEWEALEQLITEAFMKVFMTGAEVMLLCTNTMHRVTRHVERQFNDQFVHIADATAEAITSRKMTRVGLLGTRFTMKEDFYRERLKSKYGIDVLIPDSKNMEVIHGIIYNQLVKGNIQEDSRKYFTTQITNLMTKGAEGIILGCTEIPLLVRQEDSPIPLFNTTEIHALAALDKAMA